ncbi:(d)CMP kinase [Fusibacter bizertensis]|uniref:Cytidylate kinase n=1 Tax=Fusibacter bizertensis TaxID=1488331 RepID=A0ABT6N9G5_9FIRM|nr:(d)CMP kinase [Fusibacter bizertensis]MDH8677056.1 (d)CMP kinase [Fusibacter bizertensis]
MAYLQIAIDGPAGSGKSTVAKEISKRLGITYLDTGAMYRAVTLEALNHKVDLHNPEALKKIVNQMDLNMTVSKLYVNNIDVTDAIRTPEVTRNVSVVSMDAYVRSEMVKMQQKIALGQAVIMDGRDIGTVVLPNATYKFFLVADPTERAKRRLLELKAKGFEATLEALVEEIILRDELDSNREISPLKKAEDAIEVDTTSYTIEEVVVLILDYVKGVRK